MENLTIQEIISKIAEMDSIEINDDAVIYAKKINGYFQKFSETVVVELTEEELGVRTDIIALKKCPGFDYFLEVFLVKNMLDEVSPNHTFDLSEKVEAIIHYAEFDA